MPLKKQNIQKTENSDRTNKQALMKSVQIINILYPIILYIDMLFIPYVNCAQTDKDLLIPCKQSGTCKCIITDPKDQSLIEYSLWPFNNDDGTPNLRLTDGGDQWNYDFNLCTGFSLSTRKACQNVCGCQIASDPSSTQAFPLAPGDGPSSFGFFNYDLSMLSVTYKTLGGRSLVVNLTNGPTTVITVKEYPTKHYNVVVASPKFVGKRVSANNEENGLSVGSILVIAFFVLLVLYFVTGILFMKYRKQASGKDLIPNLGFWTSLPGLIKDGCVFFGGKVKSLFSKNSYEAI